MVRVRRFRIPIAAFLPTESDFQSPSQAHPPRMHIGESIKINRVGEVNRGGKGVMEVISFLVPL